MAVREISIKSGKRMYATGEDGRSKRGRAKAKRYQEFIQRGLARQAKEAEARRRFEEADRQRFERRIAAMRGEAAA